MLRDDHDASCHDLQLGDVGYGSSCRFPTKTGATQEPITHSFSMDCFAGGLGRRPQTKEPAAGSSGEAGPSHADGGSSSNVADHGAGETSGRLRRLAAANLGERRLAAAGAVPPRAEAAAVLTSRRTRGGA
ncbi:unnamed protein product [Miscanthus lutarioriparius]|uniref:Uncharacterized protein n=1 Tax=Miscanthus lutarioriparius TaxID=422564 RepID=A0A811SGC0_9POAL|nr:unnamed protein product [Miscanthus lutarioriparius]